MVFDQLQCFLTVNKLTYFQHAYSEGNSTCTPLKQITDFSVACDIVDHSILLEKRIYVLALHHLL
jgi:hypothetical protein